MKIIYFLKAFIMLVTLTIFLNTNLQATQNSKEEILFNYSEIAQAMYEDSLVTAKTLQEKIQIFITSPTEENLSSARLAWKAARVPYQQTEGYRFGNSLIDEWEGNVNSWPLDEGLIDYVDTNNYGETSEENPLYTANIIANPYFQYGHNIVDTKTLSKTQIKDILHEANGIEANVAIGYHAIEFLLWGQDHFSDEKKSGQRPATDFDTKNCTHGFCERRSAYLLAITELLVDDLTYAVNLWTENGAARNKLFDNVDEGIKSIFVGLGSLTYGELAGERIKLGLMLHDPEEEHDCFSDNTHYSHYYNQVGMMAIFYGQYTRIDGSLINGGNLFSLLSVTDNDLASKIANDLTKTLSAMQIMVERAENIEHYDQMLAIHNNEGNKVLENIIECLSTQSKSFEQGMRVVENMNINF